MRSKLMTLVMLLFTLTTTLSAQQVGRWEVLGEKTVNFKTEKDVIKCGQKGTFTRLKIRVDNAPVEFERIFLEYGNGEKQEIRIRQRISAGGESREIDLKGNRRNIKNITFYYSTDKKKGNSRGKAKVSVWGRH
ncbi:MAG: hypothetical protein ACRCZY_02410 [Phocaeicola sp.]